KKEAKTLSGKQLAALLSRAHTDPVLEPYAELVMSFGIITGRENLRENLKLNSRVMRFAPNESVVYRQALLLAMNGDPDAAQRQFKGAARAYPGGIQRAVTSLRELVVKYPEEFTPLLELAVAKAAESRDPPAAR
ncbi:MAG: Wzy polymerase domain-containing protein, partial [Burkholderiales bacterium]|nr:Wzy polymerase domain-containing protein [Burkholderiales bacterium]